MKTVSDILRDADPLSHDAPLRDEDRDRLRRAVVGAASNIAPAPRAFSRRAALFATVPLLAAGLVAIGSQLWPQSIFTVQAAVRVEVRLAEDRPAAGLREARVAGTDRVVYLHPEAVVTNDDIAQSRVVAGDGPSRFGVAVQFTPAGSDKMQRATTEHNGRPMAILIDGIVVSVPVVRGPIGASAVISGDFTKAEAERIVNGIGQR